MTDEKHAAPNRTRADDAVNRREQQVRLPNQGPTLSWNIGAPTDTRPIGSPHCVTRGWGQIEKRKPRGADGAEVPGVHPGTMDRHDQSTRIPLRGFRVEAGQCDTVH